MSFYKHVKHNYVSYNREQFNIMKLMNDVYCLEKFNEVENYFSKFRNR